MSRENTENCTQQNVDDILKTPSIDFQKNISDVVKTENVDNQNQSIDVQMDDKVKQPIKELNLFSLIKEQLKKPEKQSPDKQKKKVEDKKKQIGIAQLFSNCCKFMQFVLEILFSLLTLLLINLAKDTTRQEYYLFTGINQGIPKDDCKSKLMRAFSNYIETIMVICFMTGIVLSIKLLKESYEVYYKKGVQIKKFRKQMQVSQHIEGIEASDKSSIFKETQDFKSIVELYYGRCQWINKNSPFDTVEIFKKIEDKQNLYTKLKNKDIHLKHLKGRGFDKFSIRLILCNYKNEDQKIKIAQGQFFHNSVKDFSNLFPLEDYEIIIPKHQQTYIKIYAFCGKAISQVPDNNDLEVTNYMLIKNKECNKQSDLWRFLGRYYDKSTNSARKRKEAQVFFYFTEETIKWITFKRDEFSEEFDKIKNPKNKHIGNKSPVDLSVASLF